MNNTSISPQELLNSTAKQLNDESWIMDLDPLLQGHFKIALYRPLSVQMRQVDQEGQQIGVKDIMNIRLLVSGEGNHYTQIKIQLNSDKNLFFAYVCKIDQKKFQKMKKLQSLNFNFQNLLAMLIKQIELCDKNLAQYSAVFYLNSLSTNRLDFIQNIEYKRIELISFQFEHLDEELLKDYVRFRFTKMKTMNQIVQNKTKGVLGIVKLKNPNLLHSINKKLNGYSESKLTSSAGKGHNSSIMSK